MLPGAAEAEKSECKASWATRDQQYYFYQDGHHWTFTPRERARLANSIPDDLDWLPLIEAAGDTLFKAFIAREPVPPKLLGRIEAARQSVWSTSIHMIGGKCHFYQGGRIWYTVGGSDPKLVIRPSLDTADRVSWKPLDDTEPGYIDLWTKRERTKFSKEGAAEVSNIGIAFRLKENDLPMFWTDDTFYFQKEDGKVHTFKGKTVKYLEDWMPLEGGSEFHKLYEAKEGAPKNAEPGAWSDWTKAIGASPVNVAMRRDVKGHLWIRTSKDRTWQHMSGNRLTLVPVEAFKHYTHWVPMPGDHALARRIDKTAVIIEYRDPKFPPHGLPEKEIDEWVRTGSSPMIRKQEEKRMIYEAEEIDRKTKERDKKAMAAQNAREKKEEKRLAQLAADRLAREQDERTQELHDEGRARMHEQRDGYRTVIENPNVIVMPKAADDDLNVYIDIPSPEVMANLQPMVEALASTTKLMVEIGDKTTASHLATQMGWLIGGASWHLRNNRTEYARRGNTPRSNRGTSS